MSSVSDLTRSAEQWIAGVLLYGAVGMAVAAVCAWVGVWITTAVVRRRLPADGGGIEYATSAQPRTRHVWASPGWWSPVAVRLTVFAAAAAMTAGIVSVVADPDFRQYEHVCACIGRAW